jgi:hypothetical protein
MRYLQIIKEHINISSLITNIYIKITIFGNWQTLTCSAPLLLCTNLNCSSNNIQFTKAQGLSALLPLDCTFKNWLAWQQAAVL